MSEDHPKPRLFLITPKIADWASFAPLLEAAVTAADVACVLLRTQSFDEGRAKTIIRTLAPIAQKGNAAVLVQGDSRLAARTDADGVHVAGPGPDLADALAAMKPNRIVGCGHLLGRDAAMAAGEAGVDYLLFGGPADLQPEEDHETIVERVAWWATIFNVPCVGYAAAPDRAGEIAAAGAEFVALCAGLWDAPDDIASTLGAVERALQLAGAAA